PMAVRSAEDSGSGAGAQGIPAARSTTSGGAADRIRFIVDLLVRFPWASPRFGGALLDERDLVDLAEGGDAREHLLEGGIAEHGHALLAGRLLDLHRGPPLQDHLPDAVRHVEQLRHRRASQEARPSALLAALRVEEGLVQVDVGVEAGIPE